MKTRWYLLRQRLFVSINFLLFFILLLAACGGPPTTRKSATPTPGKTWAGLPGTTSTSGKSVTPTTVPMPSTQTSCPPVGTARAAVMAPLVLGSHATVVYVSNQMQGANPTAGTLKRYDITTKRETAIVSKQQASISEAQVSADGKWVLFSTQVSHRSAIQLVRLDGQGLQTLYCSASGVQGGVSNLEWSPDQKYVAFLEEQNVYLLTMATGAYQREVRPSTTMYYVPRTWLDTVHLYLAGVLIGTETPPLKLYLLDIRTAKVQQVLNSPVLCGDFDGSIDGTKLFTNECRFVMPVTEGPSSIRVQPATGGSATTIYTTPTYAITTLRVASRNTLLFVIANENPVSGTDTSHNGLWKIKTDGSGLTRLISNAADESTMFNSYTQYIWSTISRDGETYAVKGSKHGGPSSLLIGSMSGGKLMTVATNVELAGWTTM
jgi:eukaryotic-like serine/threonine-protein kinase